MLLRKLYTMIQMTMNNPRPADVPWDLLSKPIYSLWGARTATVSWSRGYLNADSQIMFHEHGKCVGSEIHERESGKRSVDIE